MRCRDASAHAYGHVADRLTDVHADSCGERCIDMLMGMCIDMCMAMCIDISIDMCVDMSADAA